MRFKKLLPLPLMLALFACDASLDASNAVEQLPEQTAVLEVGNLTLRVEPSLGGRLTSLLFQDRELLAQASKLDADNWGSTLWISPQESWGWPPPDSFDNLPYTLKKTRTSLSLKGPVDEQKTGLQIVKNYELLGADRVRLTYDLINPSTESKRAAAWEVTRVPIKGLVLFAQEPTPLWWSFGSFDYQTYGDITWIDARHSQLSEGKLNINGRGWLAWVEGRTLLVKRFADLSEQQQAHKEAEVQIYISPRGYMELEAQSAVEDIPAAGRLRFTTEWQILTLPDNIEVGVDSPSLMTYLQTLGLKL